jgi:aquaporin Z
MTGLLMFVILGSTDIKAPVGFAGLAIGLALSVIHLVSIPVTNTSVNPARSIGPALFAGGGAFAQLWLFILAPCIGAAAAAFVYTALRPVDPEAQITTRAATQALPTEQGQRIDAATANPPVPTRVR